MVALSTIHICIKEFCEVDVTYFLLIEKEIGSLFQQQQQQQKRKKEKEKENGWVVMGFPMR